MISIRKERPPDVAAREALLDDAFGSQRWRKSSQRLRDGRAPSEGLAFVATDGKRIVGTARLWDIVSGTGKSALLLGPVAVASDCRNRGIGAALVRRALLLWPLRLFRREDGRPAHARSFRTPAPARS
jgi:predicted N-acetyltransferase YhbS